MIDVPVHVEKLGTVTADIHSIDQGLLKKEREATGKPTTSWISTWK